MKEAIKLTTITGGIAYVRNAYEVSAVFDASEGDLKCTIVHFHGVALRVKETPEIIAELLGWTEKQIEPNNSVERIPCRASNQ